MRSSAPAIVRSFTPVFLWMILLYALSSLPGDVDNSFAPPSAIAWVPPALQNALHLPAYGVLAWLWFRALNAHGWRPMAALCAAFVFASIFGGFDELHQMGVPGRYASLTDLAANIIGSAAGAAFAWHRQRFASLT
jgi:hypothetical protein